MSSPRLRIGALWVIQPEEMRSTPVAAISAIGCGDAVAALFLGWLLNGKPLPGALAATITASMA